MLKRAKQSVLHTSRAVGISRLFRGSAWRKQRLLVIGYHGVSVADEHEWNPSLFIPADVLRQRFELIVRHGYNVIPLDEAIKRLYDNTLPDRAIALTFDDGFYNFATHAFPLLREFNFPATVYLTTYYSEFNRPIFGIAADYILWRARDRTLQFEIPNQLKLNFDLSIDEDRKAAHATLLNHAASTELSAREKDALLAMICKSLGFDYDRFANDRLFSLLSREEVSTLAKAGVDFQLHTHRHRVPKDQSAFQAEILENSSRITRLTGSKPSHFCYPSGENDPIFFPWLRSLGIRSATTCVPGFTTSSTNEFLIPRLIDTLPLSPIEFETWLSGEASLLPRRRLEAAVNV